MALRVQEGSLRVRDVRREPSALTLRKGGADHQPGQWIEPSSPGPHSVQDAHAAAEEYCTVDASSCTWGSGVSAQADTADASASAESSGRLPAANSFPLDAFESMEQRRWPDLTTTHTGPTACWAWPEACPDCFARGTPRLLSQPTPQRLTRSYLATEAKTAAAEQAGAVAAAAVAATTAGAAVVARGDTPCAEPSQRQQPRCSTATTPAPAFRHSAPLPVAVAPGRLQLRTKIRQSHVCQLQPGTCEQLARLARAWGCALVSFCARPGCVELVMDLVHVAAPVDLDPAGPGELAVSIPLRPAGVGERSPAAWPAAELASWLQQQGLLNPSLEPQLLVQVGDRDVLAQWTEPAGPCAVRTQSSTPMPAVALGLWTAAPLDPHAAAPVAPRAGAPAPLPFLHMDAPGALLSKGLDGPQGGARAELHVRCSAAAAAAGKFYVRCGGADLPTKMLGSTPTTARQGSQEGWKHQQHQRPREAEVVVTLAVQRVPVEGALLLVELQLGAENGSAAPSSAACGAAAGYATAAPPAAPARLLLSNSAPCMAVCDAAAAQELRCLRASLAGAVGAADADEPIVQAATDQFLLDLGLLLDFRAAVVAGEEAPGSEAAAQEVEGPDGGGGGRWVAAGLGALAPHPAGRWRSGAELQRQQRAWLRDQGSDAAVLRQHLSDVAATVLAGCLAAALPYTAQLVTAAVAQLQLCGEGELLAAAAGDDASAAVALQELLAAEGPAAQAPSSSSTTTTTTRAEVSEGTTAIAGSGTQPPADGAGAVCSGAATQLPAPPPPAPVPLPYSCDAPTQGLRQRQSIATDEWLQGGAAAAPAAPAAPAGGSWSPAKTPSTASITSSTASAAALLPLRSLAALLRCCVQGFVAPGMEVAYWDYSARQLQGACRLMGYITMGVALLASARAYFQDGAAVAVFLLLYQGMQALAQLGFAAYGTRRALFAAGIVGHVWRNAAHLLLGLGLVPMPSLVLPMSRQCTDLFNEGVAKPVVEQMPLLWFIGLCVGELPFAYCLYARLNGGQHLLTPSATGRACLGCAIKAGSALLVQLYRRGAFAKAYSADAAAGRKRE